MTVQVPASQHAPGGDPAFLAERMQRRLAVGERFARDSAAAIAACAAAMADRFFDGATLLVLGTGAFAPDAQHNAVEYVHPVLPGCRALPAISLGAEPAGDHPRLLRTLGRRGDIVLAFGAAPPDPSLLAALQAAREMDMLTVALLGGDGAAPAPGVADHVLQVRDADPLVAREVHLASYHILWELVHIVLNHRGIPAAPGECITCSDRLDAMRVVSLDAGAATAQAAGADGVAQSVSIELLDAVQPGDVVLVHGGVALQHGSGSDAFSQLLYPMLSEQPPVPDDVITTLAQAPLDKMAESNRLRAELLAASGEDIVACARRIAGSLRHGGRLYACGNGGSATTAADLATELLHPGDGSPPLPAASLSADVAVVTAVADDVGFDDVYTRQLIAMGHGGDVLVAISTSGNSENLVRALHEARARGMLAVAISGYDGGRMVREAHPDHAFTVRSSSVHRIQEVQTTLCHLLVETVRRGMENVPCA